MAKLFLDRLRKKYNYTGGSLNDLTQKIIANNSENISRKMARLSKDTWTNALSKITTKPKEFKIPDIQDVIPKRGIFITKATQQQKLITDTLRDDLTRKMRQSIKSFKTKTGEPKFLIRRGERKGRINTRLIAEFRRGLTDSFSSYTKKDPRIGVPPNIKQIATTELRSSINDVKLQYMNTLSDQNQKNLKIKKRWLHNLSLSKHPRRGHVAQDFQEKLIKTKFRVKNDATGGIDLMDRPHDPGAPLEQIIGCNCDLTFIAQKI